MSYREHARLKAQLESISRELETLANKSNPFPRKAEEEDRSMLSPVDRLAALNETLEANGWRESTIDRRFTSVNDALDATIWSLTKSAFEQKARRKRQRPRLDPPTAH